MKNQLAATIQPASIQPALTQLAQGGTSHPFSSYPAFGPAKSIAPWRVSTTTQTGEVLTIRTAEPADAASLATIGGKGFAAVHQLAVSHEEINGALATAWGERQMAELIANPAIQTIVAEVEGQIVGLASLNPTHCPSYLRRANPVELGRFYLHLDWIGCGVGSKLMAQALERAAAAGYGLCWLRVWQGNQTALSFYRRWGFTTISADYYPIGSTLIPVWVMIHSLSSQEEQPMAN